MMRRIPVLIVVVATFTIGGCSQADDAAVEEASTTAAVTTTTAGSTTANADETTTTVETITTVEPTSTTGLLAPVPYGPTVLVAGREDCELYPPAVMPTWTTDADGTVQARDGQFDCTVINNDPRIAGTAHYTLDLDRWGTSEKDAAQVQWGTIRIENEGGAWETEYVGIYTGETGDVFAVLFTGTGSYEGLFYYQWAVETFGASWPTKGLIFPATTDPIP